ncbi:MAG: hypothetical protein OEM63_06415, partial [Gammaproteobacteria bacterium]|nr:hypothetical protein [Gammaproteobacteria bacterium]
QRANQVAQAQAFTGRNEVVFSYYWSGQFSRAIEVSRDYLSDIPGEIDALDALISSYLDLSDVRQAEIWTERATSVSEQFRDGYKISLAKEDFPGAIAHLEQTLEIHSPRRNLWVLLELFEASFYAGDEIGARSYLNEYIDARQGRLEVRPNNVYQLNNVMIAAFWILHGDDELAEPARGRELAEEIRTKMQALKDLGWLHPQLFAGLAAAQALLGEHDAAIANLNEAIDSGYRNQEASLDGLSFDGLRDDPRFSEVSARIEGLLDEDKRRLASLDLAPYTPPVQREILSLTREQLEVYEGWYSNGNALSHVYVAEDGQFVGTLGQNEPNELVAIAGDEFFAPSNQTYTVQYVTDANGIATHFLAKGGFGEMLFKKVDDPPPTIELSREVLARYEGTYSYDRLGDLEGERAETDIWGADIYVDDAGLIWIDYDNQPKLEIRAVTETEFDLPGFHGGFIFQPDPETGTVNSFIMTRDGREYLFYRD